MTLINRLAVLALALAASTTGFAGQKTEPGSLKHTVVILQDATLAGTAVAQGSYEAEISGDDAATLVLRRDKKEVARARVRRSALAGPAKYDRVDVRNGAAGKEIATLYFKGDPRAFEVVPSDGVAAAEKP